ncbi:MAG: CDP-alcohol phosphatidyltransferase family protein [Candidatus Hydrogenedentes bacterium]|nr:CDP-alcohol phosphatidyltransferase family protein [Candidatus Hydrogenedentota bacterium]
MVGIETNKLRYLFAWSTHFFTSLGAVCGFLAIIEIGRHEWFWAFIWMALTVFIDSIDGFFARMYRVKELIPNFDGALLDNIIDYFTYVIVPASFLYEANIVPQKLNLVSAFMITISSAYQFCQKDAKTEDHWFKGFPSYWNIVIFYLYMLELPAIANFLIILILTVLIFVPFYYLYPSRTSVYPLLNVLLVIGWALCISISMFLYPKHKILIYFSLLYVIYYFVFSIYWSYKRKRVQSQCRY